MTSSPLKIISASRRIELVGFFPQKIIEFLKSRCPPERVHTVVLWSKNPQNLIDYGDLNRVLASYDQLFLHLTITGMGGSYLEAGIPPLDKTLAVLPRLVEWVGDPQRIRLRFDPIVHLQLPDGSAYTNLNHFTEVARAAAGADLKTVTISWMENYPKVQRRLENTAFSRWMCLAVSGSRKPNGFSIK